MKVYVGIDPGKTGAVVEMGSTVEIFFYDAQTFTLDIIDGWKSLLKMDGVFVAIEKAQAMPKQGVVSMFNYGVGYGEYIGALKSGRIPFQEIRPQTWKKEFGLIGKGKEQSIVIARKIFPSAQPDICLKKHHGRAEALLLAEYARRHNM